MSCRNAGIPVHLQRCVSQGAGHHLSSSHHPPKIIPLEQTLFTPTSSVQVLRQMING